MNKQDIIDLINNNEKIKHSSFSDIDKITSEYPYFQTAHLLLAKKAQSLGAATLHEVLPHVATHVANRAVLYKLLYPLAYADFRPALPVARVEEDYYDDETRILVQGSTPSQKKSELEPEIYQTDTSDDETLIMPVRPELIDDVLPQAESPVVALQETLENLPTDTATPQLENPSEVHEELLHVLKTADSGLEKEIDTSSISLDTGAISEEARKLVELELEQAQPFVNQNNDNTVPTLSESIQREIDELIKRDIAQLQAESEINELAASQEAHYIANKSLEEDPDLIESLKRKVEQYKRNREVETSEQTSEENKPFTQNEDMYDTHRSISNEIKAELEALRQAQDEQTEQLKIVMPETVSSHANTIQEIDSNVFDTESLMNETMAKVFARQGYYEKAIAIYEQLIVKFPEKKHTFAQKIEELKSKI